MTMIDLPRILSMGPIWRYLALLELPGIAPTCGATARRPLLAVALQLPLLVAAADAETWPQFRGSGSDGIVSDTCPQSWDASTNVRWKVAMHGEGWSSPVVWNDHVFITEAVRTDVESTSDLSRPEPYRGGGGRRRTDLTQVTYRWDILCLDAATGALRWQRTARTGRPPIPRHSSNTYATETPVTDGERVYAYFGMNGVFCYDFQGNLVWERDLGTFEMRAGWGTASSPVLFEGLLFLQVDNEQQSFLVSLDADSGREIWRVDRPEPSQYSSPIIWQNSLRNELIVGGQTYRSYDPSTGRLLWQLDMEKGRSSATALAVGDRLYAGTEFRNRGGSDDGGGFLFAVLPGGDGSLSANGADDSHSLVAWRLPRSGIQMASPVLCEGYLYLLERRSGTLHCIDAGTGQVVYRRRIPGARAFWASPWTCDGRIYCPDADGTTYVLAGGPQFRVLSENVLGEQTWASPAIQHGALFLRTADHLYCIAERE
jgi:outer membrane protein assembly factor BamB